MFELRWLESGAGQAIDHSSKMPSDDAVAIIQNIQHKMLNFGSHRFLNSMNEVDEEI